MELTIDQALQKGIKAHKAGQVQEADRLYTAILKAQPKHPDANHNMGVLAVGVGKVQEALPFFKTALKTNPSIEQFWLSYIDALIKVDRLADARVLLDQAYEKGIRGDLFNTLEQRLKGTQQSVSITSNCEDPPQDQLQLIINLRNNGCYEEVLVSVNKMLKIFPRSAILCSIIGATNADLGNFNEAIKHYKQALEVRPDYADVYNNMGVAFKLNGGLEKAISSYKKAIEIQPNHADAYSNMGSALAEVGKLEEAIDCCERALSINPDHADAHNNLGVALMQKGEVTSAIENYKKAIRLKPGFAETYNSMGVALNELGKLDAAIDSFKKALDFKDDYADAFNNMGNALKGKGLIKAAVESYKRAIEIQPDHADAYNNMGAAIEIEGDVERAVDCYLRAITIKPSSRTAFKNMANALSGVLFFKPNPIIQDLIISMINRKTLIRPKDISNAAVSLLKFDPIVKTVFDTHAAGLLKSDLKKVLPTLGKVPLLLKLMGVCPLADLELESVLTEIRSGMLFIVSELGTSPDVLQFQSALALQCFTNEYIYNQSDIETKALETLGNLVEKKLLDGEQPSSQQVLCLASYKALQEYEWKNKLTVNNDINQVFEQQILEPQQESLLKLQIPVLNPITDLVSSEVRKQYEANPYPRWVNLGLDLPATSIRKITKEANLKLLDNQINDLIAPEILIAGCGTGQHSIGTAARFRNSKVLAIDLSLASLAYAKRKTDELGILNVEYMQADILDLRKLNKNFDIIESGGVLHHMNDPLAGWEVLSDCLKPGGLMMIGLYSELARQHIVEIRSEIKKSNVGSNATAMKSFRSLIIASDKEHHKRIHYSNDFYSLSTLRDLLFHVQEKRFTLLKIKECLSELGLEFCGFSENKIVQEYNIACNKKDDPYDLDKWQIFENAHPNAFAGMYQFWCQKIA
ncbi:tetratricopeptide repeat protein [Paracoccaceae bacterium]|nr:tetratricopeptide repeat protein [Paracoccaceae bacterium]